MNHLSSLLVAYPVYPEIFLLIMTSVVTLLGVNATESRLKLTFGIACFRFCPVADLAHYQLKRLSWVVSCLSI